MKNLQLSLKRKWFEMTKSRIKTEDYREINEYWAKRLVSLCKHDMNYTDFVRYLKGDIESQYYADNFQFNNFYINRMTLGYPKSGDVERIVDFKHKGIEIRTGNPEWGADPNKLYFVILHGEILNK